MLYTRLLTSSLSRVGRRSWLGLGLGLGSGLGSGLVTSSLSRVGRRSCWATQVHLTLALALALTLALALALTLTLAVADVGPRPQTKPCNNFRSPQRATRLRRPRTKSKRRTG